MRARKDGRQQRSGGSQSGGAARRRSVIDSRKSALLLTLLPAIVNKVMKQGAPNHSATPTKVHAQNERTCCESPLKLGSAAKRCETRFYLLDNVEVPLTRFKLTVFMGEF